MIRTRDPNSNALVAKEKSFNLEYVAETVATNNDKLGKKYHFRTNGESSVKNSIHDRSTELASNFPSIAPEKRASVKNPILVEKVEFGKKPEHLQLPDIKRSPRVTEESKDLSNGTLDKRKNMFFVFIGDPKHEYVASILKIGL